MIQFILLIGLTSLWIFGFRALFQEGMIFGPFGSWLWGDEYKSPEIIRIPHWICKPLFQCPPCMASIHGTYSFFLLFDHSTISITHTAALWIGFCVCLCGLNYLLTKLLLE